MIQDDEYLETYRHEFKGLKGKQGPLFLLLRGRF
jgi:hypothetical protein